MHQGLPTFFVGRLAVGGQQAWVAERSTTLTRSSWIETAISRGGHKGVLSVAEYLYSRSVVLSLEAASIGGGLVRKTQLS